MEVGKQIRKFRKDLNLSQEELAAKIFVTRQSISNWEKGKNYPDLKSLVLLCQLFDTSLDILVKGDVGEMKKQIEDETRKEDDDAKRFKRDSNTFAGLLIVYMVLSILICIYVASIAAEFDFFKTPLTAFETLALVLWVALIGLLLYYAARVERQKRELNIKTFQEILGFLEGNEQNL